MTTATVFIVDDDASMRTALTRLLRSADLKCQAFASAREFLEISLPDEPCCLVLDVRMPGMSGVELQQQLAKTAPELPIIFITGHGDIRMAVKAVQQGAVEFLPKPFEDRELLGVIRTALERHATSRQARRENDEVGRRIALLTRREREVMDGVLAGRLNKQIGLQLGIAEKTVKVHRARVMTKMGVSSVAELVRMVESVPALRRPAPAESRSDGSPAADTAPPGA